MIALDLAVNLRFDMSQLSHISATALQITNMSKTKIIHFFRHAQAEHNVWSDDDAVYPDVRDTSLTPVGIEQVKGILASAAVTNFKLPTLLISSPLRRCLQTALPSRIQRKSESYVGEKQGLPSG